MSNRTNTGSSAVGELLRKHRDRQDLHITRVMGALVAVSGGLVIDVDAREALSDCPMHRWFGSADPKTYIEEKIARFGHFSCCREIRRDDIAVPYGTSEMLMTALQKACIEAAVTVSDGAGSVITDRPEVVQGIGARMNGLFYTSPVPEVIERYRREGCMVYDDARIDQLRAVETAAGLGYRRIGVTVNAYHGESFAALRSLEESLGVELTLAAVCSTGISQQRAEELTRHADLGWSCASKYIRSLAGKARLQLTQGIPVFVYTQRGLELLCAYTDEEGAEILRSLDSGRSYLLSSAPGRISIRMWRGRLSVQEAKLPVGARRQPEPLR